MNIQDDKKRERIYTHHKTVLNKKGLLKKLPGWDLSKFDKVLDTLKQNEVIEVIGNEVKIFLLPISEKEFKDVRDNNVKYKPLLTEEESELLTLLTNQSIPC
ncbi:MAG: hypothetical protein ACYC6P_12765 [Ignavibacteriaceae bacterium]